LSYEDVTRRMIRVLKEAKIPHMITGGLAAIYYGCPRATYDLDLVVRLDETGARRLVKLASEARFRAHEQEVLEVIKVGNRFVMESPEKYRVDFWMARTAFEQEAFARRRRVRIFYTLTWISSPEDIVIQKLRACRPRDIEDAQAILIRQRGKLDEGYLKKWASELGLARTMGELMERTEGGAN